MIRLFRRFSVVPFDGESGDPGAGEGAKTFTQEQVNKIVTERLAKEKKTSQEALARLEELQTSFKGSTEEKEALATQLEELRGKVFSAEEIRQMEEKKAKTKYEKELATTQTQLKEWQTRHNEMLIDNQIGLAAAQHGVLPAAIPFLAAYLKPQIKITEVKDGNSVSYNPETVFNDIDADGKKVPVTVSINDAVKRMKDQPEQYGNLFTSTYKAGLGGSGSPGGGSGSGSAIPKTAAGVAAMYRKGK